MEHLACSVPLRWKAEAGSQAVDKLFVMEDQARGGAARGALPAIVAGGSVYILSPVARLSGRTCCFFVWCRLFAAAYFLLLIFAAYLCCLVFAA
ncbi:hypothetical protein [Massilia sp. METH4]|uniref:hypothetical protein n=1 Tax=Massilia sp. METH4 TaxID=3123041 RepID=UPI0030D0562F